MPTALPAIYRDDHGTEEIVFQTDGSLLTTEIRGTSFTGRGFDDLEPTVASQGFTLHHGMLCGCSFVVRIPIRLVASEGLRIATSSLR